jgi:hypothetical protein
MTRQCRIIGFVLLTGLGLVVGVLLRRVTAEDVGVPSERATVGISEARSSVAARPRLPQAAVSRGDLRHGDTPQYHPRDSAEWQGMLVDLSMQANCESSMQCGLAMACRSGRCGPCTRDSECGEGEGCVLDHCLLQAAIGCRSRSGCGAHELCVLSGYSADPRSNAELTSRCMTPDGGARERDSLTSRDVVPAERTPVRADDLLRELEGLQP